ncbi:MAG: LytTR family DNA-binding domain-containing protein [Pseudomonadales bacterium]
MLERLTDYFRLTIPLDIDARARLRALWSIFLFASLSTVVIHLFLPMHEPLLEMLLHAALVGLTYAFSLALLGTVVYRLRRATVVHVWQIWLLSLAGFTFGYYLVPLSEAVQWLFGLPPNQHAAIVQFWELLPVWALVTFLFVQPYIHEQLRQKVMRLTAREQSPANETIEFEQGRNPFSLAAADIRNIAVDDHHCYIYYWNGQGFDKRDIAAPLRDVATMLPAQFLQVHRSHVVNTQQVEEVRQRGRKTTLLMKGGFQVPVSRHRLREVMPDVQAARS